MSTRVERKTGYRGVERRRDGPGWIAALAAALALGACGQTPAEPVAMEVPVPLEGVIGRTPLVGAIVLNQGEASEPYQGYCTFNGAVTHEVTLMRGPRGQGMLTCHWASYPAPPPGRAQVHKDFPCSLNFFGLSTSNHSRFVFAPSGLAQMTCLFPSAAPKLVKPKEGFTVLQNVSLPDCTPGPHTGSGYRLDFRWTPVAGADGYQIFVHNQSAQNPLIDAVVSDNQLSWVSCRSFVIDRFLEGWRWRVRGINANGGDMPWSEWRSFSFEPCRLSDGTPCSAPAS